jgi:3-methylcrotonyl-CoA carboxylase alpha subunit
MSASEVKVTALGNGRFLVGDGTRQRLAFGVSTGETRWVFLDGRVHVIGAEDPARTRSRQGHDDAALSSPMPGTVVLVNVEPGQKVSRGELLVMLEAMKMEVAIKAPHDGTVKSIACRKGELVQPGVPLLEFA